MGKAFLVVTGGGIGALCRYGVSLLAVNLFGDGFPWGTLLVNLSGCFLIGLSFSFADRNIMSASWRLFFVTGFLGGLTTFSTFALETTNALRGANNIVAGGNFLFNNVGGLILVFFGMWVGRIIN